MAQPTMSDVANRAGVSRALVSLVMRGEPNVSSERRSAVLAAATELGYRPNVLARNLASRKTMTLGVMINDLHNPFFAEAVDGVQERADELGYRLLMTTGGSSGRGEVGAIETFLQYRVDGLILTGPRLASKKIVEAAKTTPTVLLGRSIRSTAVDSVNNDELIGARLAVDHLVDLGHRRIAHIDGGQGAGAPQRRSGYEAAMAAHGLDGHVSIVRGGFTEQAGLDGIDRLFDVVDPPTAIFAANDLVAAGAMQGLERRGSGVPDAVSVVGYDNSAIAQLLQISLTTVNQPREEMGRTAVDLLLDRIASKRTDAIRHTVTPTLQVRASTAPPS